MSDFLVGALSAATSFCGNSSLSFWDPIAGGLGECFQTVFVLTPAHLILGLASAYFLGKGSAAEVHHPRSTVQLIALCLRLAAVLVLVAAPVVGTALLYSLDETEIEEHSGFSQIYSSALMSLSWAVHFVLVAIIALGRLDQESLQGATRSWLLCAVADGMQCHSLVSNYKPGSSPMGDIFFAVALAQACSLIVYLLTLLPGNVRELDDEEFQYERLTQDPLYLGVAKADSNFFSKFVFFWVNPLIRKGRMGLLQSPDDVFEVPIEMDTSSLSQKFHSNMERLSDSNRAGKTVILRVLFNCFGRQFFAIGVLKFMADCSGFAGPLLLNELLTFMESQEKDMMWGYIYASGLAASTFVTAMCNTHFTLFMAELGLKVRAAVTTAVYRHTLKMTSSQMGGFGVGEIINFMSTDTDRIVNFSPTLHSTWSLPLQFSVTMILLYKQVGLSCLVGVAITIIMIPLNKHIVDMIFKMSTNLMAAKDERVKIMSEVLHGVRSIKFFAWEDYFLGRVNKTRNEELKYLKGRKYLDAICTYLWATTPVLISVLTFVSYALLGNVLTAAKVFTSVALFAMLTGPLNAFPWVLNGLIEAMVSIRRVSAYLTEQEIARESYFSSMAEVADMERADATDIAIGRGQFLVQNGNESATSADDGGNRFILSDITLNVEKGDFIGVIGRVGSGKSTLLSAILGELKRESGGIAVTEHSGGVGYVSQEPWLQQGTIRDNILFGKEYDQDWYQKVTDACTLGEDFQHLCNGDATNVGEQGSMLSGGQKARVSLARAIYQDKEIYLIDDVFSAVDVPVGKQIYQKCIQGLLRNKTKIVCTHHPRFLAGANTVLLLEKGRVVQDGPAHEVLSDVNFGDEEAKKRSSSRNESESERKDDSAEADEVLAAADQGIVDEETRGRGRVKLSVFKEYLRAVGTPLSIAILMSLAMMQATKNLTDVWLAEWVTAVKADNHANPSVVNFYLPVYGGIAGANSLFAFARAFLFAYGGICAAKAIHKSLIGAVIHAKPSFFSVTPVGWILNRFSSDLYTVDDSLPFILNIFLARLFGVFGVLIVCIYSVPWIVLLLVPLAFIYFDIQKKYRPASRDLKRVASVALSPIYAHFSETLNGLATIRAMKESERFVAQNEDRVERSQKSQYAGVAAAQWLQLRLQMIGVTVVAGISVIAVLQHHGSVIYGSSSVNPGYLGLALSYALGVTSFLADVVSMGTEAEKELVAVERCSQYLDNVPRETSDNIEDESALDDWPSEGIVSFKDVCFRYRENLPLVLQNLTFETRPFENVGIVGRTGAGKSSLFQALFRLVSLESGIITVDGIDISTKSLRRLRRSMSIIPQDPFLFSGSMRENLDPYGLKSDEELWDSLRKAHMADAVGRMDGGLDSSVEERGRSFSIVCVDEATANVDLETDALVQDVLRSSLGDRTVITIAHRIETILSADRVFVMAAGKAVETGKPRELLMDMTSAFSKHVNKN